jgi:hypothetical protein
MNKNHQALEKINLSWAKVLLLMIFIFQSDEFISNLLGLNVSVGGWIYSVILIFFFLMSFTSVFIQGKVSASLIFYYPLAVFGVVFFVSMFSAAFIFEKPIMDWLPSLYIYIPIFIFYFLHVLNYKMEEVVLSIVFTSILVSIMLVIDQYSELSILDYYVRKSTFFFDDVRRVVLLKNELVFGFVLALSAFIFQNTGKGWKIFYMAITLFLLLVQGLIMESRLAILAMGVSAICLIYFNGISNRKLAIYIAIFLFSLFFILTIFDQHIERISEMKISDDSSNISVRIEATLYYFQLYLNSMGFGFGSMSSTGISNNVLYSHKTFNIADIGFFSSLFQFGILGMLIWLRFTYRSMKVCKENFMMSKNKNAFSIAVYAFLLGFILSPLPLSFFTQAWCINTGGILLYIAWLSEKETIRHYKNMSNHLNLPKH